MLYDTYGHARVCFQLADQFFSSGGTESFKMDAILNEMRGAECGSREESWPTTFANKTEKQVSKIFAAFVCL